MAEKLTIWGICPGGACIRRKADFPLPLAITCAQRRRVIVDRLHASRLLKTLNAVLLTWTQRLRPLPLLVNGAGDIVTRLWPGVVHG